MDIYSQSHVFTVALMITRIVDGRCNSLKNPGTTLHPGLIVFGRGPANSKLFFLDCGVLQATASTRSTGDLGSALGLPIIR